MDIYAEEGHKIKFTSPNAGYEYDQKQAETHLLVNETYTVERTEVGNFSTDVYLKEVPGLKFNSVLFDDA
jgi:hypothetical protein